MVAMHDGTDLVYFAQDHLSSTSIVMNDTGGLLSQNRYLPFGQIRDDIASSPITQTDFGYTGQRNLGDMGLMDYKARFYSPTLMRFIQPDTIVPNPLKPQSFNRFSYVNNNPTGYVDPTGHKTICMDEQCFDTYEGTYSHVLNTVLHKGGLTVGFPPEGGWGAEVDDKDIEPNRGDELDLIEELAEEYDIDLPPGNNWNVTPWCEKGTGGLTVTFSQGTMCYTSKGDNYQAQTYLYDQFSYITLEPFDLGYTEIEIASVMVEEARHAWQEWFIEHGYMQLATTMVGDEGNEQVHDILEVDANMAQIEFLSEHGITSGNVYDAAEAQLKYYLEQGELYGLPDLGILDLPLDVP
jgi:RHS repeat-associated protein